jgi:tetratricopeptide (TPR) repeat protein
MALHGQHIIHRDLKPSNVLVTHEGRVVVLDFGLVLEEQQSWSSDRIAGTPQNMAPEQAAGAKLTAACDWYAVGVMLYEALAGRAPFLGPALRVLQAKQSQDPPTLATGPDIPEDLAALTMQLLSRDPSRRPDPRAIAKVVASQAETGGIGRPGSGPHLVGREQQLAALQEAYRLLRKQQQPLTVFIPGRSGEGKTSLAECFLEPLRQRKAEVVVMSGRCYDRESVPFKALDSLIDSLASYLQSLPETDAALLLPDDMGLLVQVFPVLQRVKVVEQAPRARLSGLDEPQVRQRAFRALRALLWRLSSRTRIIWFIDDLQWGDADSAEALFEVLRPPDAPVVLFLGTYRSDEAETSPFLHRWEERKRNPDVQLECREVAVGPLSEEQCAELVVALLRQDTEAIQRRAVEFAQEASGNPLLLIELVGCFDPATDSFHALPIHEVIRNKLGRLPADAELLLEVVAISGQALAVQEASKVAGQTTAAVATLTHMRNERLIRLIGPEEKPLVDTYHDRIREAVLGQLQDGRRKALHLALAEVIEKDVGSLSAEQMAALEGGDHGGPEDNRAIHRVYDLAYHFDAAGQKRKAWMYALLAAEQARRQFALDMAVNNYALAKRNAQESSTAVHYRIAEGYGETLMLLGRYAEANEQLEGVIDLVGDAERKARIEALQGDIAIKQGLVDKSIAFCEQGLRRLGIWVPRTGFGWAYGLIRESCIQVLHSFLPFLRHRKAPSDRLHLIIRFFELLSISYMYTSTFKMVWAQFVGMNRAELLPPSPDLALSYAAHGCIMSSLGWHARGLTFGNRAVSIAKAFDNLSVQAYCFTARGFGCCASARYEEALAHLNEGIATCEKAGDQWMQHLARFHRGYCHYRLGNLAEAIAEARWMFACSERVSDSRALCASYLWARAAGGNIPFEELANRYPCRPDDIMATVHSIMARGYWHSYHGRTAEALEAFEEAARLVRTSWCVNFHTIGVLPALVGALRIHAGAVQQKNAHQGEQMRRRAFRLAKWATRITRFFPTVYPHALRERSLMLAAYGKTWKALQFAEKSCIVAERQQAKYEQAQSLLVRGNLARRLGLPEADEQIRTAEATLEEIDRLGPRLGQHTDEILKSLLGLSEDEVAALRERRVI